MKMFQIIFVTVAVSVLVKSENVTNETPIQISKPKIIQDPAHKVLYIGEKVALHCNVSEASSDLEYHWYKDSNPLTPTINHHTITPDTEVKSSTYECLAKKGASESEKSDPHTLTVQTIPTTALTLVSQWAEIYSSEKVTLKCEIQGSSENWTYKLFNNGQTIPDSKSQSNIYSGLDAGNYTCQGSLQGRLETSNSNTVIIKNNTIPTPILTLVTQWTEIYPSEKVKLKCEIQGSSENWTYKWFKSGSILRDSESDSKLEFTATKDDSGYYKCQGSLPNRVNTSHSEAVTLKVNEKKPKPDVRKDPSFDVLYNPENVTLECNVQSSFNKWEYLWYKNNSKEKIISRESAYTISSVQLTDIGTYFCQVKRDDFYSMDSDVLSLNIKEIPEPKLTVDPEWKEFFPSEEITLQCGTEDSSTDWSYQWIKDGKSLKDTPKLSIKATLNDSGQYACKGKLNNRPVNTKQSDAFQLNVKEHQPKPLLSRSPGFQVMYTGEQVTFHCEVKVESLNWEYLWFKDSKDSNNINTDTSNSSFSVQVTDSGEYWCQVKRRDFRSDHSDPHTLTVKGRPKPEIKSDWREAFPDEEVSLQCVFPTQGESENWMYMWFQDSRKIVSSGDGINKTGKILVLSVKSSHNGTYVCQAELQGRSVKTENSSQLMLRVYGLQPTVNLKQHPEYRLIYTGEEVKLNCSIQEQTSQWEYLWYKNSSDLVLNSDVRNPTYTITNPTLSQSGSYTCKVRRKGKMYSSSQFHNLSIEEPPQPKLSIESKWTKFYPTEKVTMKCSIIEKSDEWDYEWFRNGAQVKDKKLTFSGNTLSITSAKSSDSGSYTCLGKHKKRLPVTTQKSEPLALKIYDTTPEPEIKNEPLFKFYYTEEHVQFDCSMTGEGWTYHWFKDSKPTEPSTVNPTYSISSASLSHSGAYYCQAKRGDFTIQSKTVNIQVEDRPPAVLSLLTQWGDIMAGNLLTLTCEVTYMDKQWNYTWYENGQKLNASEVLNTYTVKATEETIKSEFKCRGISTERPLYSSLSEGFRANNIVFKRKILLSISGFVVCCIVILIIGCIVLKVTRKPEKKERNTEDLFFSMADSKNQTISPLKEYMDHRPTEMEVTLLTQESINNSNGEHEEKELLSDNVSAEREDGAIKEEDTQPAEANGLTSFKGT